MSYNLTEIEGLVDAPFVWVTWIFLPLFHLLSLLPASNSKFAHIYKTKLLSKNTFSFNFVFIWMYLKKPLSRNRIYRNVTESTSALCAHGIGKWFYLCWPISHISWWASLNVTPWQHCPAPRNRGQKWWLSAMSIQRAVNTTHLMLILKISFILK